MEIQKVQISDPSKARAKVLSALEEAFRLVSLTLGPDGKSVIIERGAGEPLIVDDGRRVMENMKLSDPLQQLVVRVLYEVCRKTDEKVGDGTTSSAVLTYGIVKSIVEKYLPIDDLAATGMSVAEVERRIMASKDEVFKLLNAEVKQIESLKDLTSVATAVMGGDAEMGATIAGMYHKLGRDGHIALEFNLTSEQTETEVAPGLRFSAGYADKFMVTDAMRNTASFVETHVLLTADKALDVAKLKDLIAEVRNSGKSSICIIAPKFTPDFLKSVYHTAVKSKFSALCIRAPGLSEEHWEDVAIWTGGKYFGRQEDVSKARLADLGYVERVDVTDDTCVLTSGKGDPAAVKARIEEVRAEAAQQKLPQFKQIRLDRISALSGGVGVIRIGAPTDVDRNWFKHKIEDAKYATKLAYREGVVRGGGLTLSKISAKLPDDNILKDALLYPSIVLRTNAGGRLEVGKDVLDPVAVVRTALENACSAAAKLIRIGGFIGNKVPSVLEALSEATAQNNPNIQDDEDQA